MADKEGLQAWTSTLQKNIAVKKHGPLDTGRHPHPNSPRGAWPPFALTQSAPDVTRLCPLCLDHECTPKLAALLQAQALPFPTSYSLPCDDPILLFLHLPVQLSSPASSASPGLCPRPAFHLLTATQEVPTLLPQHVSRCQNPVLCAVLPSVAGREKNHGLILSSLDHRLFGSPFVQL